MKKFSEYSELAQNFTKIYAAPTNQIYQIFKTHTMWQTASKLFQRA